MGSRPAIFSILGVVANLFRRSRFDRELHDEIAFHIESRIADLSARGLPPEEARRRALIEFGGAEVCKERVRDVRRFRYLDEVRQDLFYAFRTLRRSPGFAATAILSLALGIGANTGIFSLVDAVILKPLPVARSDELLVVEGDRGPNAQIFSFSTFTALQHSAQAAGTALAAMTPTARFSVSAGASGASETGRVQLVSADYFATLNIKLAMGLAFEPNDDRLSSVRSVAVISDGLWRRAFAGARQALGQTVTVNTIPLTIVGIAPQQFSGVWIGEPVDVWLPLGLQQMVRYRQHISAGGSFDLERPWAEQIGISWLNIITRAAPSQRPHVEAALAPAFQQQLLARERHHREQLVRTGLVPQQTPDVGHLNLGDFSRGFSPLKSQYGRALWLLMVMVAIVLLVTCANIANLLLARAAARQKEIAVRLSIGAGRPRVVRQLLTESLVVSVLGGVCGWLVAIWTNLFLVRTTVVETGTFIAPPAFPLDWRVFAFAASLSIATALLFGLAPAFRATAIPLTAALATGSRAGYSSRRTTMSWLVGAQVAMAMLLLIGAGLFGRSLVNLYRVDPGFDSRRVLSVLIDPRAAGYPPDAWKALYQELTERLKAVPGVESLSTSQCPLLSDCNVSGGPYEFSDLDRPGEHILENRIGTEYFATVGIRLLAGREFNTTDAEGSPRVAIVNQSIARRYFYDRNPVGLHFRHAFDNQLEDFDVVGVVQDARTHGLRRPPVPMVFYPAAQMAARFYSGFDVRARDDARQLTVDLRRVLAEFDPHLQVMQVVRVADRENDSLGQERLLAYLAGSLAFLALMLASLGLFGVLSYVVMRQTPELGVRKALGASTGHLVRLVVGQSMLWVCAGLAVGFIAAAIAVRLLAATLDRMLFGQTATDPVIFASAAAILLSIAAAAAYEPARRASCIDAQVALRYE